MSSLAAASGESKTAAVKQDHDLVLILDFGSQFSHLIARRVREINVYCELQTCLCKLEDLTKYGDRLKGVILSGGPSSVYEEGAPHLAADVWAWLEKSGLPILGICYGMQEIAQHFGGKVEAADKREYGFAKVTHDAADATGLLFKGLPSPFQVWNSHGDKVTKFPPGFKAVGSTENTDFAAIVNREKKVYGLQFHPEVTHTPEGTKIISNFVIGACGASADWNMEAMVGEMLERIKAQVGPKAHVIGAVSGGVDSTVAAVLMTKAIGDRFHAILVDNGCLRLDEAELVVKRLSKGSGGGLDVDLRCVDASDLFLERLAGVDDPERKRKIIGGLFIEVFEKEAKSINGGKDVDFLLQGTLYPDVIESCSYKVGTDSMYI